MTDKNKPITEASVDQVGIVVRDLRATVEALHQLLGIGPFRVMEFPIEGVDPQTTYYGKPASYKILLGFGRFGATQIELVQPLEGQSIWSDFLETHGPGLHHFRITLPDFEEKVAQLEAAGITNMATGTGAHVGSKWAYFDTRELLGGILIELRKRLEGADGEGQWVTTNAEVGEK